ncbi:unnamed protein product [marine sediment metagenome]|uniref:Uncharacterized protein n=1 Tax=marine sediment metagenome TaxID=412755 RepID=X1F570_9ZZZZ
MSVEEKLKEAQELAAKPIDLSEPEKEKLTRIIELMKGGLNGVLEDALSKPRDEAFEIIRRYLIAIQEGGSIGSDSIDEIMPQEKPPAERKPPAKPIVHPQLDDILTGLPEDMRRKARELLPCVKSYISLEEEGENGSQVLCPDCNPEKMIVCLRAEDPTIVDEMDEELRKAGVVR